MAENPNTGTDPGQSGRGKEARLRANDVIGMHYQNLKTEEDRVYFLSLMLMMLDHNRLNTSARTAVFEMLRELGSVGGNQAGDGSGDQDLIETQRQELLRAIPADARGEMIRNMLLGADLQDISSILAEFGEFLPEEMEELMLPEEEERDLEQEEKGVRLKPYQELYDEVMGEKGLGEEKSRLHRPEVPSLERDRVL